MAMMPFGEMQSLSNYNNYVCFALDERISSQVKSRAKVTHPIKEHEAESLEEETCDESP
jgi:ectoine hydroxylase-related dioxygenase (phytanoyl-CoA dioxygenase family)